MVGKEVIHANAQPVKVVLVRTKGGYNWEIHVQGSDMADVLPKLREANNQLKREYGGA